MLPSIVASELQQAVREFLRSAFPIATPFFQTRGRRAAGADSASDSASDSAADTQALIDELIQRPEALFKGPYLDIKLPFRLAPQDKPLPFDQLILPFRPYQHQLNAFERLCAEQPRSTLVATGTGSGKTECFMYPVLDHCLSDRQRGIKAIVIYPMNALATDQARRFAAEVAKLETRLTVGLFVGGEQQQADAVMGPNNVITCQRTLRENPPDILLTNYKMLDFLLIRPKDQRLWRFNALGRLRYLVVDELHTFDGAQGTDLACLIRRLKARLEAGQELACVGTSATIGSERTALLDYARDVFASHMDADAVVGEDRLTPREYLDAMHTPAAEPQRFGHWPVDQLARLDPGHYVRVEEYLFHQARLWFDELPAAELPPLNAADPYRRAQAAVQLGELLHRHRAFQELIQRCVKQVDMNDLAADWQARLNLARPESARHLVQSLVSLVSAAREWRNPTHDDPQKWCQPLLQVRQQLWLRELRRMVCSVPGDGQPPVLRFSDDLQDSQKPLHLPLLHCRECHLAAWGAVLPKGDSQLNGDLQNFYQAWFQNDPQVRLLVPLVPGQRLERQASDGPLQGFCPHCLGLRGLNGAAEAQPCAQCSDEPAAAQEGSEAPVLRVWLPNMLKPVGEGEKLLAHHNCPECGARDAMTVVGYRAATLISVMTGQLFDTPFNDDHKLIAFSDSVQDAAHRAGFLGANTWRQLFRQAFYQWLAEQPVAPSLAEAAELMPAWWRERLASDERYCGLFIAPNMEWLRDYAQLTQTGQLPPGSDLAQLVSRRLAWECVAEFGRRATYGRSLERSGRAVPGWEPERLMADVSNLAGQLREEVGSLADLDDAEVMRFVLGWLIHLRQIGAIHDAQLNGYLANKGQEYLLNRLPWMPGFGRSQRPPAAITLGHVASNFEALLLRGRESWSLRWLKKTLGEVSVFASAEAQQILSLTVQALTRGGWLVEREAQGQSLWLLAPERLVVSCEPAVLACSDCRHTLFMSPSLVSASHNMACLRPTCTGRFGRAADGRQRDAALVQRQHPVAQQMPQRLVASEHTGLLPRDRREYVEHSFIHGHEPWDVNLLSATPTLEMGIDIGALSSVFLCSVPPAQANYLQRIGRAGRRDGNALAVTVANAQNHDNFFFADPLEMLAGDVQTPGVFLQATAVLERQLLAYCLDRWAATGIDDSAIPGQMRHVLDAVENQQQTQFPYTLLAFIAEQREVLLAGFFGLFERLDEDARSYLSEALQHRDEGGLEMRLLLRLTQLVAERDSLARKVGQLRRERERLSGLPQDDATRQQVQEVEGERGGHAALLSSLNRQLVLNFLTDEGLLPNYAFPEEGVTLRSVILRRLSTRSSAASSQPVGTGQQQADDKPAEKSYEKSTLSLQRSAQAALGELAPESRFYAVDFAMPIDQVDLQLTQVEEWRFCDRCQYIERVDLTDRHSACPRCFSAQWADSGQRHAILKLRQVYATVDSRADRIGDEAEQREPVFFNRQTLVDVDEQGHRGGFRLDSEQLPFGFEFLSRVTLREVNFGQAGGDTHTFSVAGHDTSRRGFRICKHCGKVQKQRPRRGEIMHSFTCKLRRHPELESDDDYFESLYLYRELASEAIRILLPLSEVAYSDVTLNSFVAALNLGLKAYFRGDVHHLEVTDMAEPANSDSGERFYLLIYDRIPGGTGYLKELMREPDHLMQVLALAHQRLASCECIDDALLDGCYRCLLAYRHRRSMPTISRRDAEQLLGELLELRDGLIPVESLAEINTNGLVESKLEQRFLDALSAVAGVQMTPELVNGKPGQLLTLSGADGRPMAWHLEHQVRVGSNEGVAVASEIDALLTPARAEDARRFKPIAVYLDGLQYHHEIVDVDVQKRQALLRSGWAWVFSLNWDDLPERGAMAAPQCNDVMRTESDATNPLVKMYSRLADAGGWPAPAELNARNGYGGLDWLLALLRDPALGDSLLAPRALYRGVTLMRPDAMQGEGRAAFSARVAALVPAPLQPLLDATEAVPGGLFDHCSDEASEASGASGAKEAPQSNALLVALPRSAQTPPEVYRQMRLHLWLDDSRSGLDDDFKARWRAFWHAANQLQFAPGFSMATQRALATGLLEPLWHNADVVAQPEGVTEASAVGVGDESQAWLAAVEHSLLEPELLEALSHLGLPLPEVGSDIATADGEVVIEGADVELCWPQQQLAVVELEPDAQPPTLEGWRFLTVNDSLLSALEQQLIQGVT
ncbi:MAG: DEAD/DEAH box helicase [Halomonas sp.]|uniref:DEAD/DEAH box helicase n=1 Tax=Halomonas sp. TaxID=1486246 RepID=UPI003F93A0E8